MRLFDKVLEMIVAALVVVATVVGFCEVVARYGLGSSIVWSFEFLQIILVYITFVGGFLATRQRAHLRVTVLVEKLPRPVRFTCFLITQAGIALTAVVMTVWGFDYAFLFPDGRTDMLRLPVIYLYIIVPICGVAMTVQVIADVYVGVRNYLRGQEPEDLDVALPGFEDGSEPARSVP